MQAVALSRVTRGDADALIQAHLDSRAIHHPWVYPFTDQGGFDSWFGRTLTGPMVALVARETATGAIAGVITLGEITGGLFQNAYLGYYGTAATAGLMTTAVSQACRIAFEEFGLHRLEANIQPGNVASIALARRIGFRFEGVSPRYLRIGGTWRDHERWAMLADEFQQG